MPPQIDVGLIMWKSIFTHVITKFRSCPPQVKIWFQNRRSKYKKILKQQVPPGSGPGTNAALSPDSHEEPEHSPNPQQCITPGPNPNGPATSPHQTSTMMPPEPVSPPSVTPSWTDMGHTGAVTSVSPNSTYSNVPYFSHNMGQGHNISQYSWYSQAPMAQQPAPLLT